MPPADQPSTAPPDKPENNTPEPEQLSAPQVFPPQSVIRPSTSDPTPAVPAVAETTPLEPIPPTPPGATSPSVISPPVTPAPVTPTSTGGGRKKLLVPVVAAAVLLLGGSASAYYLGVVVPNKPENVWKTALSRTAKGYDSLVDYANQNKNIKGVNFKGDYKLEGPVVADGSFEAQTYEQTSTFKADIGMAGARVNLEGRTLGVTTSKNPDIYIKASGLKSLGSLSQAYAPIAQAYDNQWLFLDHTLLDQLESLSTGVQQQQGTDNSPLTPDDYTKVAQTVGTVSKEYVFTTDSNKAVLTVVKEVGKEKQDGRNVYHYEVGLHKQHTKDYLNALVDALQNTPAVKLTNGQKIRDAINMDALLKSIDSYKESDTAQVYVDLGTKLVRVVRFEDTSNKQNYLELAFKYTGGDVLPFMLTTHDATQKEAGTLTLAFNLNKKTNAADGNLLYEAPVSENSQEKAKFSAKFTATPNNNQLTVEKPAGAKSLYELLGPLFTEMLTAPSGGATSPSNLLQI